MTDNKLYWLWLTLKEGLNDREMSALLETFGDPLTIYDIENPELISKFSKKAQNLIFNKSLDRAVSVMQRIEAIGARIVTIEDDEYPPLLKHISAPPYVLYMYGERMDWENLLTITMVGTRKYNKYGKNATQRIAYDLAKSGVVIVSGMARGIDSIAGMTALNAGCKTVAVLGSGFDKVYPPEKRNLYDAISKNGVVITEYPPEMDALPHNFPRRNRIMAGLSYGAVVTQAPKKSGALITARLSMENGRDVFAVPGTMFSPGSEGCNELIKQGAKLITSYEDVINEYPYFELVKAESTEIVSSADKVESIDFNQYNENQQKIIKLLLQGEFHIDEILRELEMESNVLNSELLMLELSGAVNKLNGNRYELSQ